MTAPLVLRALLAAALLTVAFGLGLAQDGLWSRLAEGEAAGRWLGLDAAGRPVADLILAPLRERAAQSLLEARRYRDLGVSYLGRARETGDLAFYNRAEAALARALELNGRDSETLVALGTLSLARHQFREALEWGERARSLANARPGAYGVIGDALVELGRYEEAFAAFQRMVDLRPDLSSYARVAYVRELTGDLPGAIVAMRAAAEAGEASKEGGAWARTQLGHLLRIYRGNLDGAEREYRWALVRFPDYPAALAGLALVAAAGGRTDEALELADRAATLLPIPEHVIHLSDLLHAAGRTEEARGQDALVRAIDGLARAAGVETDLEIALFEADRGERVAEAVAAARRAYQSRPNVRSADGLAWALYQAGAVDEAQGFMEQALSLGSKDPLTHYHAARIALAAGDRAAASLHLTVALESNRHFSVRYAAEAQALLSAMGLHRYDSGGEQ